jgi:peroxiredoxin Q/BCP
MKIDKGEELPDFLLPDQNGEERTLQDLAGERGLVLYAYPKDDTPGCTIEANDFRDRLADFRALGFEVAGISRDGAESHCRFIEKYDLTFPLLTDADASFLRAIGAYGEKKMYGKTREGIIRSTVAVGTDGEVLEAWGNVRAKGHVEKVLEALGG